MDRVKLERLYKERNLNNFMLKTIEDLESIHGIRLDQIEGYTRLSEDEKGKFKTFLVTFFNAHGIGYRDIQPLKVFIAIEKIYTIDTAAVRDVVIRRVVVDDKKLEISDIWEYEKFKEEKGRLRTIEKYMRFEYIDNGENRWMHINKLGGWY